MKPGKLTYSESMTLRYLRISSHSDCPPAIQGAINPNPSNEGERTHKQAAQTSRHLTVSRMKETSRMFSINSCYPISLSPLPGRIRCSANDPDHSPNQATLQHRDQRHYGRHFVGLHSLLVTFKGYIRSRIFAFLSHFFLSTHIHNFTITIKYHHHNG
jgi:hypothetical protein